jgi:hypothetical protein
MSRETARRKKKSERRIEKMERIMKKHDWSLSDHGNVIGDQSIRCLSFHVSHQDLLGDGIVRILFEGLEIAHAGGHPLKGRHGSLMSGYQRFGCVDLNGV